MKPSILALFPIQPTINNYNHLLENFDIIYYTLTTRENFINDIKSDKLNKIQAIFGSYPGFKSIGGLNDVEIINSLPNSLKIISLSSAGYDGYDLQLLKDKNIKLTNVPVDDYVAMDVADCALWHVLSGIRKFNSFDNYIKSNTNDANTLIVRDQIRNVNIINDNEKHKGFAFGHVYHNNSITRCSKKKCVIFGYGLIGKLVSQRMKTIGMDVNIVVRDKSKYVSHSDNNDNDKLYSSNSKTELTNAVSNANVIIICLPGGSHTENIINKEIFQLINDNSIIVNIGRGSCINTQDLKDAINSKKISHIGLDVFPNEPIIENYWFNDQSINQTSNNFYTSSITPHLGSATLETFEFATETSISDIINVIENDTFNHVVNP